MTDMIVNIGTKSPIHMSIDIDDYSEREDDTELSEIVEKGMYNELADDMNLGSSWISDGTRNRFAVNDCIALWVLGYNPKEWFQAFLDTHSRYFYQSDIEAFMGHVSRISEYLEKWGPKGNRDKAIAFMIE